MTRRCPGHGGASSPSPAEVIPVSRLTALLVLTAAFAPAAIMGALPVVVPVVVVLVGLTLAVTAFEPAPVPAPAEVTVSESPAPATP